MKTLDEKTKPNQHNRINLTSPSAYLERDVQELQISIHPEVKQFA